jgi:hypothetical protein
MPALIYTATQQPVKTGDVVHLRDGQPYTVTGWSEPHSPASTGRVHLQTMDDRRSHQSYYPIVIGADWIGRTDR